MSSKQKLYRQFRQKCFFNKEEARFYVNKVMAAARRVDEKFAAIDRTNASFLSNIRVS